MDQVEIMLQEYNNLWKEKLVHKESLRKFYNYLSYLSSVGSLALVFLGLSASAFFGDKIPAHAKDLVQLACIPLPPIIILFASFILNDLFQLYTIGTYVGSIEQRVNAMAESDQPLRWEHKICTVVFGDAKSTAPGDNQVGISNLIRRNNTFITVPIFGGILLATATVATYSLYSLKSAGVCWGTIYLGLFLFLFICLLRSGYLLARLTKAGGPLFNFLRS